LNNLVLLDQLLSGKNRYLLDLAEGLPVADIGAADGDLAFFLEQRTGMTVSIVDHAPTNFNSLRGARLLKELLRSRVEIHDIDLDQLHHLPQESFGLVFFLGILYHLKNPYYALESLARRSKHLVLSTRVARLTPDKKTKLREVPVAYLLHETESNNDSTNYWIFSEAGLKRLFRRTGWDVIEYATFGDTKRSDPAATDADERAFCLLRSRLV
jgi:tRNA (mo5U34)-methyltransferase